MHHNACVGTVVVLSYPISSSPLHHSFTSPYSIFPLSTFSSLAAEGWRSLFIGWLPRVSKIMPSCAIMISTYEIAKVVLRSNNNPGPNSILGNSDVIAANVPPSSPSGTLSTSSKSHR